MDNTELEYTRARKLFDVKEEKNIREAKEIFEKLNDYKDSLKYYNECVALINGFDEDRRNWLEENYARACELMKDKKSAYKLDQAIKIFKEADDYLDSKKNLEICIELRKNVALYDKKVLKRIRIACYIIAGFVLLFLGFLLFAYIWNFFI